MGGGGPEDFLKKIIRTVIRTNKIDRMTKQTKKYPGRCEKKTGKKMSKDKWAQTDIYKHWRGVSQYNLTHKVQIILSADTEVL